MTVVESRERQVIRTATAIVMIAGATLAACVLVPDDPTPEGALSIPGVIMACGLLLVPLAHARRGFRNAFLAEHVLSLGLVYWLLLDIIQGTFGTDLSREGTQAVFVSIALTAVGIWLGVALGPRRMPNFVARMLARPLSGKQLFTAGLASFSIGMMTFMIPVSFNVFEALSYIGAPRWQAPWSRGELGGYDAFTDHLQYFGYVLPAFAVACGVTRGWRSPFTLILLACSAVMLVFLSQSGGRRILGVTVGAGLLCYALMKHEFGMKRIVALVIGGAMLLTAMQLILIYRGTGWFAEEAEGYQQLRVDDNFLRLGQTIELVPAYHPYVHERQLVYLAVRPVPRIFWPGKPTDPGFDLPNLLGVKGVSLSMSMIGEWYIVWGMSTVFLGGLFVGLLGAYVNQVVLHFSHASNAILAAISLMVLFAGLRSLQDLIIMSYSILAWFGMVSVINAMRRR